MDEVVCYIHAGTERTGTSSIQRFLALNAKRLAERRIWTPRSLALDPDSGFYNHARISTASRISGESADDIQRGLGLSTKASIAEHRADVQRRLALEFEALLFKPTTIVVSSEHIHGRLRHCDDLANAKALLEPYCDRFRVVVYLRSQWELAESVASLAVFTGATELRLIPQFSDENGFDPVLGVDREYFDYNYFLMRLERAFGPDSLVVRLFSRTDLVDSDVVADFVGQLGTASEGLESGERENASIEWNAGLFLAIANRYWQKRPHERMAREHLIWLLRQAYPKGNGRYTSGAVSFMESFSTSNEVVRASWFPGRATLFQTFVGTPAEDPRLMSLSESAFFEIVFNLLRVSQGAYCRETSRPEPQAAH